MILAICCALKPAVLLLDEPTSALDTETGHQAEQVQLALFEHLQHGFTLLHFCCGRF